MSWGAFLTKVYKTRHLFLIIPFNVDNCFMVSVDRIYQKNMIVSTHSVCGKRSILAASYDLMAMFLGLNDIHVVVVNKKIVTSFKKVDL